MRSAIRLSLTASFLALAVAACSAAGTASTPEVDPTPDDAETAPLDDEADAPEDDDGTDDAEAPSDDADDDTSADAGAAPDGGAAADEPSPPEPTPVVVQEGHAGFDVRIGGRAIEVDVAGVTGAHGFELAAGEAFHSFTVRPGSTADHLDVVAVVLRGERPLLFGLTVRASDAALAAFPDHLQPQHEVDAAPPSLDWTPDGRSLVWTEPVGSGVVLRTVGWNDGPGTGRQADDNATFTLDAPADVHVDGFEITDGRWTLMLRPGAGGDPIEVRIERQADGALALPN